MKDHDISQMPVVKDGEIVGSVTDRVLLNHILSQDSNTETTVAEVMGDPFPEVALDLDLKQLNKYINKDIPAVICKDLSGQAHVITQYDLIRAL